MGGVFLFAAAAYPPPGRHHDPQLKLQCICSHLWYIEWQLQLLLALFTAVVCVASLHVSEGDILIMF